MKSILKRGSAKLGGLVFKHKNVQCLTVHEWIKADCPSDTYVQGTADLLVMCDIPIVDCIADHGVLHKRKPGKLKACKYKVPACIANKESKRNQAGNGTVDGITFSNPFIKTGNMKFHR